MPSGPSTAARGAPSRLQIQTTEPDKEAKVQGHDSPREQAEPAGQSKRGLGPRGLGSSLGSSQARLNDPEALERSSAQALETGRGSGRPGKGKGKGLKVAEAGKQRAEHWGATGRRTQPSILGSTASSPFRTSVCPSVK